MCAIGTGAGGGPIITTALGAITAMDQAITAMEQAVTATDQAPRATLKAASTRCLGFRPNSSPFRTESLSATVSVAGKRDFQGGEKSANTSPEPQISGLRDEAVVQKPRRFGAFRTPAGNLRECRTAWWGWKDSNLQPVRYEATRGSAAGAVLIPILQDLIFSVHHQFNLNP